MTAADAAKVIVAAGGRAVARPRMPDASTVFDVAAGVQVVVVPEMRSGGDAYPGSSYVTVAATAMTVPSVIVSADCPTGIAVTPAQLSSLLVEALCDV